MRVEVFLHLILTLLEQLRAENLIWISNYLEQCVWKKSSKKPSNRVVYVTSTFLQQHTELGLKGNDIWSMSEGCVSKPSHGFHRQPRNSSLQSLLVKTGTKNCIRLDISRSMLGLLFFANPSYNLVFRIISSD